MRYFFRRGEPRVTRILLVESGARYLLEGLITGIRRSYGEETPVDLLTCYAGLPEGFSPANTAVYRVGDYRGRAGRKRLFQELARNRYDIMGMVCSAEPVMTKWKWVAALRLPVKVFVLNENGDYFWIDFEHRAQIRHFVLFRAGLAGSDAVRTLSRLFLFPFTLLYLLLYATIVHSKRALRGGTR